MTLNVSPKCVSIIIKHKLGGNNIKRVKGIYDTNNQLNLFATLAMDKPTMAVLFYIGIVSGLRISDLLKLKVSDVKTQYVIVQETKTKKYKHFELEQMGWEYIQSYIDLAQLKPEDLLFSVTRQTVNNYFKRAAKDLDLEDIASHSMRKTYG